MTTYNLEVDVARALQTGFFSVPVINDIQYLVSGSLPNATPSGFSGFGFNLNDLPPLSSQITGAEFYALNASSVAGGTLQFQVNALADLSDG
ncbi:MAG: hypothetical protein ACN4GF_07715 [Lentimonas sp.]